MLLFGIQARSLHHDVCTWLCIDVFLDPPYFLQIFMYTREILLLRPGSPGRLLLYRIQATLEVHQLEDQHVSRFGKRMEGIFFDFF